MEKRQRYFEEALCDFMHDAASGGAIRHLVDLGYSVEQMMQTLSYPTPRERVRRTVYRYMRESGQLLTDSDIAGGKYACAAPDKKGAERCSAFRKVRLQISNAESVGRYLYEKIRENGAENVYFSCPFGIWFAQEHGDICTDSNLRQRLSYLSRREQDYIIGIPWENRVMYHRLNDRMREIGRKLILHGEPGCCYYFMKTGEIAEGIPGKWNYEGSGK